MRGIMKNHLNGQSSPYLIQHAENPVDWYPWCRQAFEKAAAEDKAIFLSIGYSTCHWCHVMAHESFEDEQVAKLLNEHFISIKVDKEERPDIDSIYMAVCQAFTGSGGWPTSIFMTPDQKPFFAGTYFPKESRYGAIGFTDLLTAIHQNWITNRAALLQSADEIVQQLSQEIRGNGSPNENLISLAARQFKLSFDEKYGGFGSAPKFPVPHNLIFLMTYYEKSGDEAALSMSLQTLSQMYRGGLFDHIGYGFSRYSTDPYFLVPHFEKMLYDNALLIISYCKAYALTKTEFFKAVAEKTAAFILSEMSSPDGGFYSAFDADSDGVEGKFYVFTPAEIISVLGNETGREFNQYFNISEAGNFEGKSIPNLLNTPKLTDRFEAYLPVLREYRQRRSRLHLDDKLLASWNALMISALALLYRISGNTSYLSSAVKAQQFIEQKLCEDDTLFVSWRNGKKGEKAFLDDYAFEIFALITLYETTYESKYLKKAESFCQKTISDYYDKINGGFFLYGTGNEQLIFRPKETYDGAIPSGNSVMAYNLIRLFYLTKKEEYKALIEQHFTFLAGAAAEYPTGCSMFLTALCDYLDPPEHITVVLKDKNDAAGLSCRISPGTAVTVLERETPEYPLQNNQTTFYVCRNHSCMPPVNELINT